MLRWLLFFACVLVPVAAHPYPIPLGEAPELQAVAQNYARQHPSQLSEKTLIRILVGTEAPTYQDASSWRKSLKEAQRRTLFLKLKPPNRCGKRSRVATRRAPNWTSSGFNCSSGEPRSRGKSSRKARSSKLLKLRRKVYADFAILSWTVHGIHRESSIFTKNIAPV